MFASPDTFSASLPVYVFQDGQIVEKRCEAYGWPNCTHDGQCMYSNEFSEDREKVVEWAKDECNIAIGWGKDSIEEWQKKIADAQVRIRESEQVIERLSKE